MSLVRPFKFAIDRGGTFTDVYAEVPHEGGVKSVVCKLLSEDPENYPDAPREGIRRILEEYSGVPHPPSSLLRTDQISEIRMGTTVATNALLERKGERMALLITRGFENLLEIGNQARPNIFDLKISTPGLLFEKVVEVDERVALVQPTNPAEYLGGEVEKGETGEEVRVVTPLDEEKVEKQLRDLKEEGFDSIGILFLHSYLFKKHEMKVKKLAEALGFSQISPSSEVMKMARMVPRGHTACADAYLTPSIRAYLRGFCGGFENLEGVEVRFMQSDGGLTGMDSFSGHKAILSGPAGGVVGYARTAGGRGRAVIGFDMGGTSTDVSRFGGSLEHVVETVTAGVSIMAPQLDIHTVAAGGGSLLWMRSGMLRVGPDSAGAHPGPVCYRKGGRLAVTDANLLLGRVSPSYFPSIFGPNADEPLDLTSSRQAFVDLLKEEGLDMTPEELALGFLEVANETMSRPIRNLTQMRGHDASSHALACFGGAGPQHACAIAEALGMEKVYVHRFGGILSAFGIAAADVVVEKQVPSVDFWPSPSFKSQLIEMEEEGRVELRGQGGGMEKVEVEYFLHLRYEGTDSALMVKGETVHDDFGTRFEEQYKYEFGFSLHGRKIQIDDIRVRIIGKSPPLPSSPLERARGPPVPSDSTKVYFKNLGWVSCPVFLEEELKAGDEFLGPAMVIQKVATVIVEPGWRLVVDPEGNIEMDRVRGGEHLKQEEAEKCDPIQLSIFSHRFMGIAEQMGRTLQRTSVSVNIKERLDFSCALFDPEGGLIANAPHIPVHLGAMQEAVRFQIRYWRGEEGRADEEAGFFEASDGLTPGDVLVSNHPHLAGGSHLPDITVITPVFQEEEIVFWVASRGHHADVGGIAPGSMPPHSKKLSEEGCAIVAMKLVRGGEFQEDLVTTVLQKAGTRNLKDNLSDLKAQVAANFKGIRLCLELIAQYSLRRVQNYMKFIQKNAAMAVREMLKEIARRYRAEEHLGTLETSKGEDISQPEPPRRPKNDEENVVLSAEDRMDSGTKIQLSVSINPSSGEAEFNFEGTGGEVEGNVNAPPAVTYSAVIYSLRCLVGLDIPLNQGCLEPISISLPPGSLLRPSPTSAVVGGNVLTSQRVVDVILEAFKAAANSQGCMNNITFGDTSFGYYETIAGGAGGGPGWRGKSGVHSHMTNTRITDPEIFERRYPVLLRAFKLRSGSGGGGEFPGGEGVVREIEFLRPLHLSVLTERRVFAPKGLSGGEEGGKGENLLMRRGGEEEDLGGKAAVEVKEGDALIVKTPGGGGFGPKPSTVVV